MKINEITDKNALWALVAEIDFSNIYDSYQTIQSVWPTILNSNSPTLIAIHKKNLVNYLSLLIDVKSKLNNFPDNLDPDLTKIQYELDEMIQHVKKLVS